MGQFSVLAEEPLYFHAIAKTCVRILTIPESFFSEMINEDIIHGLDDAINEAQAFINDYGVPHCDFMLTCSCRSLEEKKWGVLRRCKILNTVKGRGKGKFMNLLH